MIKKNIFEKIIVIGLDNILTMFLIMTLVFTYIVGCWNPSVYKFLGDNYLFESLVLVVLAQLLWNNQFRTKKTLFETLTEDEVISDIKTKINTNRIGKVKILSAGLASRISLISQLIDHNVEVEVLALCSKGSTDRGDVDINLSTIIKHLSEKSRKGLFEIYRYDDIASVRSIILYNHSGRPLHVYIGWYTYRNRGNTMLGLPNPSISIDARTKEGRLVLEFAEEEYLCKLPSGNI